MARPLITVLLPIYNAEKYLEESLLSIQNQTFKNFKVLMLEDGCTDGSEDIALKFHKIDNRFYWIPRKQNLGISRTLNQGLKLSSTEFIAIMNADDISLPERFTKQISFMQKNTNIVSCGTQIQCFDNENNKYSFFSLPTNHNDIFAKAIYKSALIQPTSLTKRSVFNDLRYDNDFLCTEDYNLWSRILLKGELANLNEVLYLYRVHQESISQTHNIIQKQNAKKVFRFWLSKMDIQPTDEELELNRPIFERRMEVSVAYIKKVENWLSKLYIQNQKTKVFPEPNFTNLLRDTWVRHTLGFSYLGISLWKVWKKSLLSKGLLTNFQQFKFWLKCLLKY